MFVAAYNKATDGTHAGLSGPSVSDTAAAYKVNR